jgi:hypothetical protein
MFERATRFRSRHRAGVRGEVPQDFIKVMSAALPALAVGTFVGISLFGRSSDKALRVGVLVLLFTSGCLMLA